jgi:hypothetical protein
MGLCLICAKCHFAIIVMALGVYLAELLFSSPLIGFPVSSGAVPARKTIFDDLRIGGFNKASDFRTVDWQQCPPCDFKVRNLDSDSTERDLVVTFAMDKISSIQVFVRTLRTTGCKASVAIFVNWEALDHFIPNLFEFLDVCGCTVIEVGLVHAPGWMLNLFRHVFLYSFFKDRHGLFNRVVIADLFDTVFQGDPFHSGFPADAVGISSEGSTCQGPQTDCARWILQSPSLPDWWSRRPCKNAGMFVAGADVLERFLGVYVEYVMRVGRLLNPDCSYVNTVLFNELIGEGVFEKKNIDVMVLGDDSLYRGLSGVWNRTNVTYALGDYRLFANGGYPLVLHMYDRSRRFCQSARMACPVLFHTQDEHLKCKISVD